MGEKYKSWIEDLGIKNQLHSAKLDDLDDKHQTTLERAVAKRLRGNNGSGARITKELDSLCYVSGFPRQFITAVIDNLTTIDNSRTRHRAKPPPL